MKKLLILGLVGVLSLSMFGCGRKAEKEIARGQVGVAKETMNELQNNADSRNAKEQAEYDKNLKKIDGVIELPSRSIKMKSYSVISNLSVFDESGKDKDIVVTFDYTNKDDERDDMAFSNYIKAYQNGVEIHQSFTNMNKDENTSIKAGYTIEVTLSFRLRDTETPVELVFRDPNSIYKYDNSKEVEVSYTIEI